MLRLNLPNVERREVVFGYFRLDCNDIGEYGTRRKELETYAAKHHLRLGRVFVDEGDEGSVVSRSGFAQLCLLLRLEQPHGVLLHQPEDLATTEGGALQLARRIWAAGVGIYTVHSEAAAAVPVNRRGRA